MAKQNFDLQKDVYERNFGLQKDQQAYERQLQETMFNREDNSVQRRTEDLKAAGINPILAAGQGASAGPVVSSNAPQMEAPQQEIIQKQAISQMVMNTLKMKADIDHTKADTERIRLQASQDDWRKENAEGNLSLARDRLNHDINVHNLHIDNATQDLIIRRERLDLERERDKISRTSSEILDTVRKANAGLLEQKIATEELVQLGLREDIAKKILDYEITFYDYQKSVDLHLRYRDNWGEKMQIGSIAKNTLEDFIKNTPAGRKINEIYDKITGNRG
jgi:hypothetical protein